MRLLSWNVQWCRGIDGRVDPARIAAEVRRHDPDVICLQELAVNFPELDGAPEGDQPHILAHLMPGYTACFVSGVDVPSATGRRSTFGNAIYSRFPVGRVRRHSLPWPAMPEAPSMPRVMVEAVIGAPWGPVRVATTHLEYYAQAHRAAQVERLREAHAEACAPRMAYDKPDTYKTWPSPVSAMVCGDFNLKPEERQHARMQEPFPSPGVPAFRDAWQVLNPGKPNAHTFHLHEPDKAPYCCDYWFVTEDLVPRLRAFRVDTATQASDHQPVVIELR